MFTGFIIMFRETLEAALIVGIVLSFLVKTDRREYKRIVFIGIFAGLATSIFGAFLFNKLAGGFSGRNEELFEGITMISGAILLTTMILWMMNQENIAGDLENRVAAEVSKTHKTGLFFLVFISILREGIESVIFLAAARFASTGNNIFGAVLGIIAAVFLGFLSFVTSVKLSISKFFSITNIVLILFAAGLIAHGVHELQEAHVIPQLVDQVWDINPAVNSDGSYPALHEKGYVGSILKGLLGYNGNPSLIEILGYISYIVIIAAVWGKKKAAFRKVAV